MTDESATEASPAGRRKPVDWSAIGLSAVLVLFGAFIVYTGLNRALGGITTMGWQGPADFLTVTNAHAYLIQDSHTRFLAGIWTTIGAFLVVAPINLRASRPVLNFIFAAIFIGGVARFSSLNFGLVLEPDLTTSLIAEFIGMPLLYLWLRGVAAKG
jgi:hypothetical protein